jgi:hypothetical protein
MDVDGEEEETRKLREEALQTAKKLEEKKQGEEDTGSSGSVERGSNRVGGFLLRAMQGFEKIRERVRGKSLFRNKDTGEIRIVGDGRARKREGEEEVGERKFGEGNHDEGVEGPRDRGEGWGPHGENVDQKGGGEYLLQDSGRGSGSKGGRRGGKEK